MKKGVWGRNVGKDPPSIGVWRSTYVGYFCWCEWERYDYHSESISSFWQKCLLLRIHFYISAKIFEFSIYRWLMESIHRVSMEGIIFCWKIYVIKFEGETDLSYVLKTGHVFWPPLKGVLWAQVTYVKEWPREILSRSEMSYCELLMNVGDNVHCSETLVMVAKLHSIFFEQITIIHHYWRTSQHEDRDKTWTNKWATILLKLLKWTDTF